VRVRGGMERKPVNKRTPRNLLRLAHNSHTVNAIYIRRDEILWPRRWRLFNLMAAGCYGSLTNIDIFCYVIRRPKVCNNKTTTTNTLKTTKKNNKKKRVPQKERNKLSHKN